MKSEINQSHVIPLKSNPTIEIEAHNVNIFVESHDEENVTFQVELHSNKRELSECKEIYTIDNNEEKNTVSFSFDEEQSCHIDTQKSFVKAIVPRSVTINVENENGKISCIGVVGIINLETENGATLVSDCKGTLNLESENGPIKVNNSEGEINAESENGFIKLDSTKGDSLNLETENGQIKVEGSDFRTINLETENGRITCEIPLRAEGDANIETENGSINIIIPEELEFEANCTMGYGKLTSTLKAELQEEQDDEDDDERTYTFSNGNGDYSINIETENGNISLLDSKTIGIDGIKVEVKRFKNQWEKIHKEKGDFHEKVKKALQDVDFEKISKVLEKKAEMISRKSVQKSIDAALKTVNTLQDKLCNMEIFVSDDDGTDDEGHTTRKTKIIIRDEDDCPDCDECSEMPESPQAPKSPKLPDDIMDAVNKAISGISEAMHKATDVVKEKTQPKNDQRQSRMKILDLLEKGTITSEQAERLLAAIK